MQNKLDNKTSKELISSIEYFDSVVEVFNRNKNIENMTPLTIEDYDIKQLTVLLNYVKKLTGGNKDEI